MKKLIALAFILSAGYVHAADVTGQITGNGAQATMPMLWLIDGTTQQVVSGGGTTQNPLVWDSIIQQRNWSPTTNVDGVTVTTITFPMAGNVHIDGHDCDFWDGAGVVTSTTGTRAMFHWRDQRVFSLRAFFIIQPASQPNHYTRTAHGFTDDQTVTSTSTYIITTAQDSGANLGYGCTDVKFTYTDIGNFADKGW